MSDLLVERDGDVALWTLNRPDRRNALSLALLDELDAARANAEADGVGAVVIAGSAKGVFSAGFDLDDLRRLAAGGASTEQAASRLHDVFRAIERAPFTTVTAIGGSAFGGGCELALLGDVRVAHPSATFVLPPAKIGVVYPRDGLARLAAALGPSLAGAMIATARPVTAERLERAGVLWALSDDPVEDAKRLAADVAKLSPGARANNRDLLRSIARGEP